MGSLIASSGIKSSKNIGDITINGGKIKATSSDGAAIGTDDSGDVASITIHGGDITALNKDGGGPGIGSYSGHAGRITITGGKVHATGGGNSAGIGSGFQGTSGTIWIGGDAEVTAVGGSYGAGIGGGYLADGGTITIEGGTVNATGGGVPSSGGTAGIGGGDGAAGGKITITGGYVEATGKAMGSHGGAGIGGGSSHDGGEITITGGTVIATGDKYGAGIGGAGAKEDADGGRIRISGGNITAIAAGSGAAIGGGNVAKAGDIIISGGIITAELQAKYSSAYVIGPGGNATYQDKGTFSTTEHGSAVIFCKKHSQNTRTEYILGQDDPSQWNGMIFKGNQGSVYGTMVPTEDFEIPENVTLSIPNNHKLLLKNGVTMTNQGTITVGDPGTPDGLLDYTDGVIHNYGSISGTKIIPGDPTWNENEAELTLTANTQGSYGTTVDLTAKVSPKTTKALSARAIPQKTVYFYQNDQLIGTAAVNDTNQTVLSVVLEGETWKPGSYTLTASYTGGNEQLLPAKSADVPFTVTKGDPHVNAPQVKEKTAESITLQSIPGQMYCYTETAVKPDIATAAWTPASAASLTFQNLQPDTSYYFWTYMPENDYYIQSEVSAFLEVKTEKSADQLAVEKAKELIEQAGSWMITQETANEEAAVKQWLAAQSNGLNGMADTGIIVNANDIVIVPDSFIQASDGTALDRDGTNGSFRFTITLTKGSSSIITEPREGTIQAKRFTAPVIDVRPLSSGKVGKNYEQQLTADTDGRQITWSVTASLPAGLALEEGTGMLKGIPERSGNYTFDITACNDLGEIDTKQMSVNIVKGDAPFAEEVTKTYVYSVGGDGIVDIGAIFADVEKPNGYSHDVEDLSGIIVSSSMQDGNLLFTVKEGMLHASAAIKVTVSFSNYESTTVTVKISLTDKIPLDISSTVKDVIYTGQPYAGLGEILANGYQGGFDNVYTGRNNTVYNSAMPPSQAGDYTVTVLPSDPAYSGEWKGNFIIHKAAPLGQPEYKEITSSGRTLEDAELTVGTISPSGTIQWVLDPKTAVEYKTAYEWKFTPDDTNYEELTGTIILWKKRNDSSSGGSGSSFNTRNAANSTVSGTWKQDKIGWWFQKKDGSYPKNQWLKLVWNGRSDWYYFDAQGYMVQGWFTDSDGRIYFLHDVGDNTRGHMYTGWHWIKGADGKSRCYYFETEAGKYLGHLYTNQQTPDGYTVSKNGTWTVNGVEQIR
ncbi:MAG: putative Ig domain-containing protein [Lachnospiraceae bacterium]